MKCNRHELEIQQTHYYDSQITKYSDIARLI